MTIGTGDETEMIKAGCDGSNDDRNLFCNFPRIDNFPDRLLAKNLLDVF